MVHFPSDPNEQCPSSSSSWRQQQQQQRRLCGGFRERVRSQRIRVLAGQAMVRWGRLFLEFGWESATPNFSRSTVACLLSDAHAPSASTALAKKTHTTPPTTPQHRHHHQQQHQHRATKRQGGSTKNKADSHTKHLGTKMSDGQIAFPGQIIVRQRGLRLKPGAGVGVSVDQSLFAKAVGIIRFTRHIEKIAGRPARGVRRVSVVPLRGDYGSGYAARAQAMVEARNEHRKRLLGLRAKFG
jgi:large subunit ribosomal protein L27